MVMINEIFSSIQGEGPEVGKYVTFVRFAGCNLNCEYCDSKFASEGVEIDNDKVVESIVNRGINNVVITGGEPFAQRSNLLYIASELQSQGFHVAVETNGTYKLDGNSKYNPFDLIVVSPKVMDNVEYWTTIPNATIKFVVDKASIVEILRKFEELILEGVYLMPKGTCYEELMINTMLIIDTIRKYKLDAYLGQRLHIMMGLR